MLRATLDTNVLLSALRSQGGASYAVVMALFRGEWRAVLSNHLCYEYEEILKRHAAELNVSLDDVDELLTAVCACAEEWPLTPGWNPVLADPDDEPLVQLACESGAARIVTHNLRDLAPALALGVEVLPPGEFLARLHA